MEPSRVRPRLDYADPAVPFPGPQPRGWNNKNCCEWPHCWSLSRLLVCLLFPLCISLLAIGTYGSGSSRYQPDSYGPNVRAHGFIKNLIFITKLSSYYGLCLLYSILVDVETYGHLFMEVLAHIGEDITIKLETFGKCYFDCKNRCC